METNEVKLLEKVLDIQSPRSVVVVYVSFVSMGTTTAEQTKKLRGSKASNKQFIYQRGDCQKNF